MSSNTSRVPFSSWPFLSLMGSSRLSSCQSNECQLHTLLLQQAPKTPSHVMSHCLSYFPFGWRMTKGEIWFPVCLPQPMNTHWNFEWERDLHWTDLFYILGLFFFKQLPLPSLTYLFYGKHHLHSSSDCFFRTTFKHLKSNVLWKHSTSLLKLGWESLRLCELNLQEIC